MKGGRKLEEVGNALLNMDTQRFGSGALASLQEFLPTSEEADAVQAFADGGGDASQLGPAESFVLALQGVPTAGADRIKLMENIAVQLTMVATCNTTQNTVAIKAVIFA